MPLDLLFAHEPVVLASALTLGALLLWLGATLSAAACGRRKPLSGALLATALVLVASGVWWPGHLMPGDGTLMAQRDTHSALAWMLALALAGIAHTTGAALARRAVPAAAAGTVATLVLVCAHALLVAPGTYKGWVGGGVWVSGLLTATLAASMVLLGLERAGSVLRPSAAIVAAAILSLGSALATSSRVHDEPAALWPEGLALCGMALLAAVLLLVLRQIPFRLVEVVQRAASDAPALDGLTQLPTRVYFEQQLASAAAACDKTHRRLAVLFVDLDGFKPVNDTFGHTNGDRLLAQVGDRLRALARSHGVVARVGGDEFVVLMRGASTQEAVAAAAMQLIETLGRPYAIEDRDVAISCSVGIVFYPDSGGASKLLARADAAMAAAKRAGGSCHCFYSPEMDANAHEQFDLLRDLRVALERKEMELFFQPKIDALSGKVTAAEALLRWKHPTRGLVPPSTFIPIAERFGLIGALGSWVIEDACRQARVWRDKGLRMRVAINLSAQQMRQEDIVQRIESALERHHIHPSLLTCEITESVAMEDTQATQETFRRLGEAGIHLSIDDFGTGYSSLSYLRKLPAEELKIDRSFVMDVEHSADARAVVDAVVKLAHALGLRVVAEGVENIRQQQILGEMGCDELQGYLFAKPMSARALLLWAIDDRATAASFRASLFGETQPVAPLADPAVHPARVA
jgi:diguanylate cyclase (GGDEF)-like protein